VFTNTPAKAKQAKQILSDSEKQTSKTNSAMPAKLWGKPASKLNESSKPADAPAQKMCKKRCRNAGKKRQRILDCFGVFFFVKKKRHPPTPYPFPPKF
jgi:hypothetical protein